jgi:hypothetical protein
MPLMSATRSVFVYFRVAADELETARTAVEAFQREIERTSAALPLGLMRRPGSAGDEVTLMEIYRLGRAAPQAEWGPVLAQLRDGPPALAGLLRGERHVEVFEPLTPST